jgi:hypothetical protein
MSGNHALDFKIVTDPYGDGANQRAGEPHDWLSPSGIDCEEHEQTDDNRRDAGQKNATRCHVLCGTNLGMPFRMKSVYHRFERSIGQFRGEHQRDGYDGDRGPDQRDAKDKKSCNDQYRGTALRSEALFP